MDRHEIPLSAEVIFLPERASLMIKGKDEIHLTPNERRLLELIISGKGKKETIVEEIWLSRGTIVGESSYHQLIKMLRRKLQYAGLPCSVIKTIPRYGITLASFNPGAIQTERVNVGDADSTCEERKDTVDGNNGLKCSSKDETRQGVDDGTMKFLLMHSDKFLYFLLPFIFLLSSLIIYVFAMKKAPVAFPYQIDMGGVVFHVTSLRNTDYGSILKGLSDLPKVKHVYIASNGPKNWVAECETEISKDAKCRYEYYSAY